MTGTLTWCSRRGDMRRVCEEGAVGEARVCEEEAAVREWERRGWMRGSRLGETTTYTHTHT